MAKDKKKRVLTIADELDGLGYPGIAQMLRDSLTSGKAKSNESSDEGDNEGGEDDGEGGGGNHPGGRPKN
jgi:hypothetical protein